MSTRIKVSGVTSAEDATLAARLGVNMLACVLWPRSERYVDIQRCWEIRRAIPSFVELVGIFVNAPLPLVQHVVHRCAFDHAQLFGDEPRSEVESIKPHAFKAVSAPDEGAVEAALRDFLGLRPSRHDAPALLVNLTGEASRRWSDALPASSKAPVLLASPELDASNASAAIRATGAWGVDVWRKVEIEPGRLDADRLAAFVDAVHRADGR